MESAYPQFGGGNNARCKTQEKRIQFFDRGSAISLHPNFQAFHHSQNFEENVYAKKLGSISLVHMCIRTIPLFKPKLPEKKVCESQSMCKTWERENGQDCSQRALLIL